MGMMRRSPRGVMPMLRGAAISTTARKRRSSVGVTGGKSMAMVSPGISEEHSTGHVFLTRSCPRANLGPLAPCLEITDEAFPAPGARYRTDPESHCQDGGPSV